jgi:hypothetical protein
MSELSPRLEVLPKPRDFFGRICDRRQRLGLFFMGEPRLHSDSDTAPPLTSMLPLTGTRCSKHCPSFEQLEFFKKEQQSG